MKRLAFGNCCFQQLEQFPWYDSFKPAQGFENRGNCDRKDIRYCIAVGNDELFTWKPCHPIEDLSPDLHITLHC